MQEPDAVGISLVTPLRNMTLSIVFHNQLYYDQPLEVDILCGSLEDLSCCFMRLEYQPEVIMEGTYNFGCFSHLAGYI